MRVRILLVEDDATLADGIARALRGECFAVDVARNGEDGAHLGATERYDVGLFADNVFDKYAITAIGNDISSFNQVRTDVVERYYSRGVLTPRRVGIDFRVHL